MQKTSESGVRGRSPASLRRGKGAMALPCCGLVLLFLLALAASGQVLAGSGSGYAWANKQSAGSYRPSALYSHNSSGGGIGIKRSGTGQYQVVFSGLGGKGKAGGHVQVSSYGKGSAYCKVNNWNSGRKDFVVSINCFSARGRPEDSQFTVQVSWPGSVSASGTAGGMSQAAGAAKPVKVEILPNGHVRKEFADGSWVERWQGGFKRKFPGQPPVTASFASQVPPAVPASHPDTGESDWLAYHNERLLGAIRFLLGNDESATQRYLQIEKDRHTLYEQIAARTQTISLMVQP